MVLSNRNVKDRKRGFQNLNPEKEQSSLLRCSTDPIDCSFLDFTNNKAESAEAAIEYLASILAETYRSIYHEQPKSK